MSQSPVHFNCFYYWIKKFLEMSTKVKETYFLTVFGNESLRKFCSQSKLASELTDLLIA